MKYYPKKKWGQNFLIDDNIVTKIINILGNTTNLNIIEIGPGKGALTKKINSLKIFGFEIDPVLCEKLEINQIKNLICINEDILKVDLESYKFNKVIGNLPYYISSQIIFKFLNYDSWDLAVFMIQKELADRITSENGSKQYGRISVMLQACCNVKIEFNVSPNCFFPKPKVSSSIISLKRKKSNDFSFKKLEKVVKKSFSQRRKKLKNTLTEINNYTQLSSYYEKRPEMLSVDEFIEISNIIEFDN
ncbi:MAG: ribosomal RNA small subunit methyltransferase A [Candidatus Marinimicrobia bacterium]|nr:ribosomal RNA small subunit methyltransferase A [Candidatus Neomarinimicrobiota bacterium]